MLEIRTFEIVCFWSQQALCGPTQPTSTAPSHNIVLLLQSCKDLVLLLWPLSPPTSDMGGWGPTTSTSSEVQAPPPAQFVATPSWGRASYCDFEAILPHRTASRALHEVDRRQPATHLAPSTSIAHPLHHRPTSVGCFFGQSSLAQI